MTDPRFAAALEELRREYGRQAAAQPDIDAIAGEKVDRDLAPDYWTYDGADLENEMWSRMPELESGLDILSLGGWPGGLRAKLRHLLLRLAGPLVRAALARQDTCNRRVQRQLFLDFLAYKRMRQRLQLLEADRRELLARLDIVEALLAAREEDRHE
ncbi:MAG TPA: hypothetical protein PK919_02250 [Candidatus Aminicenantes bacterium]|nr:hypothetical protein [Candidatus Aminicenantes bacterium]